jgi:purine-binding chemotaxis protein CheW
MPGYVIFQLAGTGYALSVEEVRQVEMVEKVTPVPTSPAYVLGVASLRGQVLPVISLRRRLRLDERALDQEARLLVVEWKNRVVALAVDSATEFREIAPGAIQPAPEDAAGDMVDRLIHLGERTLLLLDLDKVLE